MTREPFWWPMNEPPLPYGDLTEAQASYYDALAKAVPEDSRLAKTLERTRREAHVRNGRKVPRDVQFDPARDLEMEC